ncbi:MAG: prenyltransferase [Blastocatellia bacterium]
MPELPFLFKVSRPRFWLYIFGPYLVGLAAAATSQADFFRPESMIFAVYFLFPANLLIYGINDLFDFETDLLNPKKAEYELLVRPESHRNLSIWILVLNLPFIAAAYFLVPAALISLAGFVFFSVFYSAPPIRAKSKPILDSAFNVLYIFPGIFAFQMLSGSFPPFVVIIAGAFWTMAMHAFSAIPDIESDRKAGLDTIATFLGKNGTLLFCLVMYVGSAAIAYQYLGILSIVIGAVYAAIMLACIARNKSATIFSIYKYFPLVNAATGFVLFWFVVFLKLR